MNICKLNINKKYIAPSILSSNFYNLKKDIDIINKNKIKILHIDVMDGIFVNNISMGHPIIKCIKLISDNIILDVHLMTINPYKHIKSMIDLGIKHVTFHYEVLKNKKDFYDIFEIVKQNNVSLGMAINPNTNPEKILNYIQFLDMITIMSVYPGLDGQKFIKHTSQKIQFLYEKIKSDQLNTIIQLDGGINLSNISKLLEKINIFVIGSGIFKNKNLSLNSSIKKINKIISVS